MDYGFDWEFFLYTLIYGFVVSRVTIWTHHFYNRYRERKFLKHVRIEYPGSVVTLSSVETSDAESLNKIKEQLEKLPPKE